jgi:hypothetical protein
MMIPGYIPKKWANRVMFWDDERSIGNSLIITLDYGFRFPKAECHVIGVDTIKEALAELRESEVCRCDECLSGSGKIVTH